MTSVTGLPVSRETTAAILWLLPAINVATRKIYFLRARSGKSGHVLGRGVMKGAPLINHARRLYFRKAAPVEANISRSWVRKLLTRASNHRVHHPKNKIMAMQVTMKGIDLRTIWRNAAIGSE